MKSRGPLVAVLAVTSRLPAVAMATGLALLTAAAIVTIEPAADAKSTYDSPYGFDRTWNAALRLVRVDLGYKLVEKDDTSGFLLFEYRSSESGSKPSNGSMEFIRVRRPGQGARREDVKVVVQLPQMPRYHEQVLVDSLVRKMRDEYGDPPPANDPTPTPAPADAGADSGESNAENP